MTVTNSISVVVRSKEATSIGKCWNKIKCVRNLDNKAKIKAFSTKRAFLHCELSLKCIKL